MNPIVSLIFFAIVFMVFVISTVCAIRQYRIKRQKKQG